jgi:multidrug resistance efflux pump
MGSSRSRLASKPLYVAAAAGVAGFCLVAFAEAPLVKAPAVLPVVAKAPEKDKATDGEKTPSVATTAPTTAPATQPSPSSSAGTHTVKSGKLSFTVNGEGAFVADEPFEVRLKLEAHSGPLIIAAVAPNRSEVKKGATLLELDPVTINREVAAAENDLTSVRASHTKAESDLRLGEQADALAMRIQQQETKNAESAVKWWEQVDGPQILKSSELQVKMSRANVEDQEDELDQLRKMYKGEDLTTATADIVIKRAVRQLDVSKTQTKMTEERSQKTEVYTYPISKQAVLDALEQSKQRLETVKAAQAHSAVVRRTALASAKLALAASEKKLADLKKDQPVFSIKAPADGVVQYGYSSNGAWTGGDPKSMRVGERLTSGQTVMTLFTPGDLKIELTVPESQSAWVRPGAKARVTPVAFPELSYEGNCSAPTARAGSTGLTFVASIDVDKPDPRIMPGMRATVRIDGGEAEGVLLVPVAAVSGGKVWVRDKDGKEEAREVVTGRSDGKMMEIKKGVGEGELVLSEAKK